MATVAQLLGSLKVGFMPKCVPALPCLLALNLAIGMPTLMVSAANAADRSNRSNHTASAAARPATSRLDASFSGYILGPGDALQVELLDVPEYSGVFSIGPDGTLYLPRLRALYVEGLTVDELRYFLEQQFRTYVKAPQVYVRPVVYRPVSVYLGGEIRRPGYYLLSGQQALTDTKLGISGQAVSGSIPSAVPLDPELPPASLGAGRVRQPTVFDAIRAGQGVTPFSDLANVSVTRKQPLSSGGGKIRANLNFQRLITEGDESQNIRLYDGDVVVVNRSSVVLRDQILKAADTNLSPDQIEVFVSGRVSQPGAKILPQGATLNQALMAAGGPKVLRGAVEFVRFSRDGSTDRRRFSYQPSAAPGNYRNPVLMPGDVVRVNDSLLSASAEVLNEFTGPVLTVYSLYRIFQ